MALSSRSIKAWYWIHKWSSLICMVFLLLLCITGLPLIFHEEIDRWTFKQQHIEQVDPIPFKLQELVAQAEQESPGWNMVFLSWDEGHHLINAVLGQDMNVDESSARILPFDSRTGERLDIRPANQGVMFFILDLHANLLLGLSGTLFLGVMGLLFAISIISGVVVYAPFMRRIPFGTVRHRKSKLQMSRVTWLDVHNLTGIVTGSWMSVVGLTGVILTLVAPITSYWQKDQLTKFAAPYQHAMLPETMVTPDAALASVLNVIPSAETSFISFPGSPYGTPHHYTVALKGNTPLTERLITLAMVDAETGELTNLEKSPWYLSLVNLSIPLHFGDYGGFALKIIWALLDIITIIVLGSGIYLWLVKLGSGKKADRSVRAIDTSRLARNQHNA